MEQNAPCGGPPEGRRAGTVETPDGAEGRELQIRDILTRDVVTVAPDSTILAAARKMAEHGISAVVVVEAGQVRGILTEKDVLRGIAAHDIQFSRIRVAERMSSPAVVVPGTLALMDAGRLMDARGIKRLPVVDDGALVGIVTQTDITRGLILMSPIRYVRDIMTREVAAVEARATVDEAARLMSERNISCLIARHRGQAAGIFTEKDLLRRIVALHKDPSQTQVVEIMSFPIVAVPPTYSILSASKKMDTMHLHRLVIMEDKDVCGIVTQTDILRAIRAAFERVESQRRQWEAQLAGRAQNAILGNPRHPCTIPIL
jgi:CBS domain-containing protein